MKIVSDSGVHKIEQLFTEEELQTIDSLIKARTEQVPNLPYEVLGREHIEDVELPKDIANKLTNIVAELTGIKMQINNPPLIVEYSNKYGEPVLRPHFDGDFTSYIIDVHLSSNTNWSLGVDLDVYDIEDNSALLFNPNRNVHWRPRKKFKDGEYVRAMFIRFIDYANYPDNSRLAQLTPSAPVFDEVNALRDSICY